MTSTGTPSVVRTSSQLLKFFVASLSKRVWSIDAFDRKEDSKSLEVIRLRTVTLGTFGLGGAAVDATHDGGFGFFFGGIAVCLRSMYNPSTDRYSGTGQEPPRPPITQVKLKKEMGQLHLPPISRAATERIAIPAFSRRVGCQSHLFENGWDIPPLQGPRRPAHLNVAGWAGKRSL